MHMIDNILFGTNHARLEKSSVRLYSFKTHFGIGNLLKVLLHLQKKP